MSSEPLLSGQEKGALLKRKLSFSEQDTVVCEDGRNKHKKQGGKQSLTLNFKVFTVLCLSLKEYFVLLFLRKYKKGHDAGFWNNSRGFDWCIRFWVLAMYEVRFFSLIQYFSYRCLAMYVTHTNWGTCRLWWVLISANNFQPSSIPAVKCLFKCVACNSPI